MNVMQDKVLLNGAASPEESQIMFLLQESQITLQVTGDATAFSAKVLGTADDPKDEKAVWAEMAILNMSDFTVLQAADKAGVYIAVLDGVRGCKVKLESVSGGSVTVRGRAGA